MSSRRKKPPKILNSAPVGETLLVSKKQAKQAQSQQIRTQKDSSSSNNNNNKHHNNNNNNSHLFIALGDTRYLDCDAWLISSDTTLTLNNVWIPYSCPEEKKSELLKLYGHKAETIDDISTTEIRSCKRLDGWPEGHPVPYLVNVTIKELRELERDTFLKDGPFKNLKNFFEEASVEAIKNKPENREKALIALPVIGTGGGGARSRTGAVIKELVPFVLFLAQKYNVDAVIVTNEEVTFSLLQKERKKIRIDEIDFWPELDDNIKKTAKKLTQLVKTNDLALFLGDGVNRGSRIPDSQELLKQLAVEAGLTPEELKKIEKMSSLDAATIIEKRMRRSSKDANSSPSKLCQSLVSKFKVPCHSLTHSLLAALPVKDVVTTNFDTLFEEASCFAQHKVGILPYEKLMKLDYGEIREIPQGTKGKWQRDQLVVKLHGCVSKPEDIVLTREDYLRYSHRRRALAAIVQAELITKHLLFVGFGLSDQNFHQAIDAVRNASSSNDRYGTALTMIDNPLMNELWERDLTLAPMMTQDQGPETISKAARKQDIFLDYLVCQSTRPGKNLMDLRFSDSLNANDRRFRDLLSSFIRTIPREYHTAESYNDFMSVMQHEFAASSTNLANLAGRASKEAQHKKENKKWSFFST